MKAMQPGRALIFWASNNRSLLLGHLISFDADIQIQLAMNIESIRQSSGTNCTEKTVMPPNYGVSET